MEKKKLASLVDEVEMQLASLELVRNRLEELTASAGLSRGGRITITFSEINILHGTVHSSIKNIRKVFD